jgi:FtsH-binding integral membrane protein
MSFAPPLAKHPRLGAMVAFFTGLLNFGVAIPWATHEPPRWPIAILESVLLALYIYLLRTTRSVRILAFTLIGVSVLALGVYGAAVYKDGIPHNDDERLMFAAVIAIPVAGLIMAWWMLQRYAHGNK